MNEQNNFKENLKIINNQIKQIENLVNEFSDFARMPKPILKDNDLIKILNENIKLLKEIDNQLNLILIKINEKIFLIVIKNKLGRVFLI